ncbi:MAG: HNH endonuclease [Cyanobacteria bacterium P01_A01_bin.68]
MICELCDRDLEKLTVHHLIPKHKNGKHVCLNLSGG